MDDSLADILETCLVQLEAGASVEECLAVYPQQRAALEGPLRMAARLRALPQPPMPAAARAVIETELLERVAARRAGGPSSATSNGQAPTGWQAWRSLAPSTALAGILRALGYRGSPAQPWLRLAAPVIAIVLVLLLGAGALAATRAIISVFHPTPTSTPTATVPAATPFSLDGPIEQIGPNGWVVNGMPISPRPTDHHQWDAGHRRQRPCPRRLAR